MLGMFLPVWAMTLIGKDPGKTGGGILVIGIGIPLGLAFGIRSGILAFKKSGSRDASR